MGSWETGSFDGLPWWMRVQIDRFSFADRVDLTGKALAIHYFYEGLLDAMWCLLKVERGVVMMSGPLVGSMCFKNTHLVALDVSRSVRELGDAWVPLSLPLEEHGRGHDVPASGEVMVGGNEGSVPPCSSTTQGRTARQHRYVHPWLRNANETAHGRSVPPPRLHQNQLHRSHPLLSAVPPGKDLQRGASILRPKALLAVKSASVAASVALSTRPRPPVHAVLMAPVIHPTSCRPWPHHTTFDRLARLPAACMHSLAAVKLP
ncbi:hypothetical protein BC567DRAFT_48407 [Phyllosticta citribraziliensis]